MNTVLWSNSHSLFFWVTVWIQNSINIRSQILSKIHCRAIRNIRTKIPLKLSIGHPSTAIRYRPLFRFNFTSAIKWFVSLNYICYCVTRVHVSSCPLVTQNPIRSGMQCISPCSFVFAALITAWFWRHNQTLNIVLLFRQQLLLQHLPRSNDAARQMLYGWFMRAGNSDSDGSIQ